MYIYKFTHSRRIFTLLYINKRASHTIHNGNETQPLPATKINQRTRWKCYFFSNLCLSVETHLKWYIFCTLFVVNAPTGRAERTLAFWKRPRGGTEKPFASGGCKNISRNASRWHTELCMCVCVGGWKIIMQSLRSLALSLPLFGVVYSRRATCKCYSGWILILRARLENTPSGCARPVQPRWKLTNRISHRLWQVYF